MVEIVVFKVEGWVLVLDDGFKFDIVVVMWGFWFVLREVV